MPHLCREVGERAVRVLKPEEAGDLEGFSIEQSLHSATHDGVEKPPNATHPNEHADLLGAGKVSGTEREEGPFSLLRREGSNREAGQSCKSLASVAPDGHVVRKVRFEAINVVQNAVGRPRMAPLRGAFEADPTYKGSRIEGYMSIYGNNGSRMYGLRPTRPYWQSRGQLRL